MKLLIVLVLIYNIVPALVAQDFFYFVTLRDYISGQCDKLDLNASACPTDPYIQSLISSGLANPHVDFDKSHPKVGSTLPYHGKYGNNFPLVSDPPGKNSTVMYPIVADDLVQLKGKVGKMVLCDGSLYLCDVNATVSSFSSTRYWSWLFSPNRLNRQAGYKQFLRPKGNGSWYYDSVEHAVDPQTSTNYDPFTEYNIYGFGPSIAKPDHLFSTEIHSLFEYRGDEYFNLTSSGDAFLFINDRLAINLGGEHDVVHNKIILSNYEQELDLQRGGIYEVAIFNLFRRRLARRFAIETTMQMPCNIQTLIRDNEVAKMNHTIDWNRNGGNTLDSDWIFTGGADYGIIEQGASGREALLMKAGIATDALSTMSFKEKIPFESGFALSFSYRAFGSKGLGFTLLFHNRENGTTGLNGGSGFDFGFKDIEKSFAILFDYCASVSTCRADADPKLYLYYNETPGGLNSKQIANIRNSLIGINDLARDNTTHKVELYYYLKPRWMEVYINDRIMMTQRDLNLTEIIGGNEGYVSFLSTSSSLHSDLGVYIYNISMYTGILSLINSNYTFEGVDDNDKIYARDEYSMKLKLNAKDYCNSTQVRSGIANWVHARMVKASDNSSTNSRSALTSISGLRTALATRAESRLNSIEDSSFELIPTITDQQNGSYAIDFNSAGTGVYDIHLGFGSNCIWNGTNFEANNDCAVTIKKEMLNVTSRLTAGGGDGASIFVGSGGFWATIAIVIACVIASLSLLAYYIYRKMRSRRVKDL